MGPQALQGQTTVILLRSVRKRFRSLSFPPLSLCLSLPQPPLSLSFTFFPQVEDGEVRLWLEQQRDKFVSLAENLDWLLRHDSNQRKRDSAPAQPVPDTRGKLDDNVDYIRRASLADNVDYIKRNLADNVDYIKRNGGDPLPNTKGKLDDNVDYIRRASLADNVDYIKRNLADNVDYLRKRAFGRPIWRK